ncbi:MYND-type domain-containing protein [Mycena kentingensis (nom. inval.)]|nr:MYND-type domain-containing protein [Mycena kentingensis (nom. inval.)]
MLSRQQILELLSAIGVDLPPKTKLSDAELDKRLTKTLDSAQYISRVVPNTPFDPTSLPSWSSSRNAKKQSVGDAIRRHNFYEAGLFAASEETGVEPFPLYSSPFWDLRQTLMALGMACDNRQDGQIPPIIIQDAAQEVSGIPMRIIDVRMFDESTPVLVVLYRHDVSDSGSLPGETLAWMEGHMGRLGRNVTATLKEQEMLLRILKLNSKRLAKSYKPSRAATESSFTLSFLLPIGPLTAKDTAKFNTNNGCSVCGDPAKSKCSRCAVMRYCSAICQKDDWKAHRSLCKSWESATWHRITFTTRGCRPNGLFMANISRFAIVQHGDIQSSASDIAAFSDTSPPQNTHGETPFIIKVQVITKNTLGPDGGRGPSMGPKMEHLMFYDKNRTLDVLVPRSSETERDYRKMAEVVMRQGSIVKGFVWAVRSGDWTIDVCMDSFPERQKW